MNEGLSNQIEFSATDGAKRFATLTDTNVHHVGVPLAQHTDDSQWLIWKPGEAQAQWEWIFYYAHDRSIWRVKVHCQLSPVVSNGRQINTWFEHERDNGKDNHDDQNMGFLDWNGDKWIATLQPVHEPFPASPRFQLKRVP